MGKRVYTEFRRNRALGEMALCSDPINNNVKLFFGHCATSFRGGASDIRKSTPLFFFEDTVRDVI